MENWHLSKKGDKWVAAKGAQVKASAPDKETAIRRTAKAATSERRPVSVKIHKLDGKFQEERTYPRSADPRGSKG